MLYLNKKTARRAENPARPQILLDAYRTPTTQTVSDLSVSIKGISDSGIEPPYIISNHKEISCLLSLGKFRTIQPPLPRVFFSKSNHFLPGSEARVMGKISFFLNRRLHNLDMHLQFI